MENLVVGVPVVQGQRDLDAPSADNLKAIAKAVDRDVDDSCVIGRTGRSTKAQWEIRNAARCILLSRWRISSAVGLSAAVEHGRPPVGTAGAGSGLKARRWRCLNGPDSLRAGGSKPYNSERLAKMCVRI